MNLDLRPFIVLWAILAISVVILIVRRKMVASQEDDSLHVLQGGAAISQQVVVANKLEQIDKWGKIMTVITVVFGLLVAAAYVYQVWTQSTQINPGA